MNWNRNTFNAVFVCHCWLGRRVRIRWSIEWTRSDWESGCVNYRTFHSFIEFQKDKRRETFSHSHHLWTILAVLYGWWIKRRWREDVEKEKGLKWRRLMRKKRWNKWDLSLEEGLTEDDIYQEGKGITERAKEKRKR